jgi:hypothetical protein
MIQGNDDLIFPIEHEVYKKGYIIVYEDLDHWN